MWFGWQLCITSRLHFVVSPFFLFPFRYPSFNCVGHWEHLISVGYTTESFPQGNLNQSFCRGRYAQTSLLTLRVIDAKISHSPTENSVAVLELIRNKIYSKLISSWPILSSYSVMNWTVRLRGVKSLHGQRNSPTTQSVKFCRILILIKSKSSCLLALVRCALGGFAFLFHMHIHTHAYTQTRPHAYTLHADGRSGRQADRLLKIFGTSMYRLRAHPIVVT